MVIFYSTWCGACKQIAPKIESMTNGQFADVIFTKVDVEENEDTAREYNIEAMPTFILFKDGEKVDDVVGGNMELLKERIYKHKSRNISL